MGEKKQSTGSTAKKKRNPIHKLKKVLKESMENRKIRKLRKKAVISTPQVPIQMVHTLTGQADFFLRYLPSIVNGERPPAQSRHREYITSILRSEKAKAALGISKPRDFNMQTQLVWQKFREEMDKFEQYTGVRIRYIYDQSYDLRLYNYAITSKGWCQGICAYWLRHKKLNDDIFPSHIYTDQSLNLRHGTTVTLMRNQAKILDEFYDLVDDGPGSKVLTNVLRYIGAGRIDPTGIIVKANAKKSDPSDYTHAVLEDVQTPRSRVTDGSISYVINFYYGGTSSHAVALDMAAGEFFDPNYGVFYHDTDETTLAAFVFEIFLDHYYKGMEYMVVHRTC